MDKGTGSVSYRESLTRAGGLFASVMQETGPIPLQIRGKIPGWLKGEFLRNGPARFCAGYQPHEPLVRWLCTPAPIQNTRWW